MNQQQFNTDEIDKFLGAGIDAEQAWKEFEEKQNRKRPTLFLWFGLLLLIGLPTLYLQGVKSKEQVEISQLKIDDTLKAQKEIVATTLDQDLLIEDKESLAIPEASNKKLATTLSIISMPSLEQSNSVEIEKKSKASSKAAQDIEDITFSKNTNISTTDYTQNDKGTSMFNAVSNQIASPLTKTFKERTIIEPIMELQENSRTDIYTDNNYGISTLKIAATPTAKIGSRLGFPLISVQKRLDNLPSIMPQNTIINSSSIKRYSFNLYSSAGVMQRMLHANTDNFHLRRANNEIPLYRYAFGALVSKRIKSKFKVSVGLEYNNHVTKIEDLIQNVGPSIIIENQIIANKFKDGISEPVYGNISATTIEVVKNIRYQQYRSLAIPVRIGYMKKLKKGFDLEVGGGFSYHFAMSAIGKTYKEDGTIGAYQSLSNLPYRKANLIDFNLHTGIHKAISDQLSISLRAVYNRDLNSRILPVSNATDKFSSSNLELNLIRYF